MKQVAVKGDIYVIWEDTYSSPDTQDPAPPNPPDPKDPKKYHKPPPPYDPIYKIIGPTDLPDTGEEFVFCNGKPVVVVGYEFSKLKKETYRREWEIDDNGYLLPKKEEKKSTEEVNVKAVDGTDFVFADGIPLSCREGGVSAHGDSYAVIDGKLVQTGSTDASGQFTECFGHVYVES